MNVKTAIISGIIILIFGVFIGWYLFSGKDVYNNGNGNDTINEQFEQFRENQSTTIRDIESIQFELDNSIRGISEAKDRVDRIESTTNEIREGNTEVKRLLDRSTETIRQSKQILQDIREREQSKQE